MRSVLLLALITLASTRTASADAPADVTKAYAAFIDGIAANKAQLTGVELFIPPGDDTDDNRVVAPVPADLSETRAVIAKPKLKVTKVMVSKGGKSAWIAGELAGRVTRKSKAKSEPLRVSAFLVNDDKGWRVQAAHWSTGEKDIKTDMCGDRDDWQVTPKVAKQHESTVKILFDALQGDYMTEGGVKPAKFVKILSDDKNALAIGSAPKEIFVGGAKIKGVFKKWEISASMDGDTLPARAGLGPDGEMMWVAMSVIAPHALCTSYRTLFVLAKEASGWRVVHHHYSKPTSPY